jgi:hypothetical protein
MLTDYRKPVMWASQAVKIKDSEIVQLITASLLMKAIWFSLDDEAQEVE